MLSRAFPGQKHTLALAFRVKYDQNYGLSRFERGPRSLSLNPPPTPKQPLFHLYGSMTFAVSLPPLPPQKLGTREGIYHYT